MYKTFLVSGLILLGALPAHAEEVRVNAHIRASTTIERKGPVQPLPAPVNRPLVPPREGGANSLPANRLEAQATIDQRRAEIQTAIETRRGEIQTTIEERRAHIEAAMAAKRAELEAKRAQFASTTSEKRQEIAAQIREHVVDRAKHMTALLDAIIERLTRLADRIDARIKVLAEAGADVSAAKTALADARAKIEVAAEQIALVQVEVESSVDAEKPSESLAKAKQLGTGVKEALRAAHEALIKAVQTLPKASVKMEVGTTTGAQ